MTGRRLDDEYIDVIDVTPKKTAQIPAAREKGKFSFFRRLVLTLFGGALGWVLASAWRAFRYPAAEDSTYLWEFGYQMGSTHPIAFAVGFLIAWITVPLAFSPDK